MIEFTQILAIVAIALIATWWIDSQFNPKPYQRNFGRIPENSE